ncbi:hypothetical protein [Streptomyces sp. NPDC001435]|uniref:hypothetical protein n=1 Tax=unclassified Streptomyces TaxID=2593676 RepID=UPI0036959FCE
MVLVLPLASTELLFALPLLAERHRRQLTQRDVTGTVCAAGGVAAFLACCPTTPQVKDGPAPWGWPPLLAVVTACVTVLVPTELRASARFARVCMRQLQGCSSPFWTR